MMTTKPKKKYPAAEKGFLPSEERPTFRELYLAAFAGLDRQFEQYNDNDSSQSNGLIVYYDEEDQDSLMRSKHLARMAYNSAMEACKLLEKVSAEPVGSAEKQISNFNKKMV